jgi:elongation factor 1-alpha
MVGKKPHINLVFVGHVDHGKSTTVGRLMFDAGVLPEQELRKLKEKAAELGKAGFEFAFVMDKVKEEQERGVTIDLSYMKFETDKYYFTIIDAPGHRDFIKNMITGTSQADAAVLAVAANDSVMAQTKEHVFLARTLGVNQMIVAVNKMDMVDYKEETFNKVKDDVTKLLKSIAYPDIDKVQFIPVSSLQGDNVVKKTDKMPWFKGSTLLEAFSKLTEPEKPTKLPLRMPVQDVYTITGIGTVPVGRIETGVMKVNQKLVAMPSNKGGELKSIEMHHEQMPEAGPGDNVGISIRGIGKLDVRRGDVLGTTDNPPKVAKEFTARIMVLEHPSVVTVGYSPVFHCHTAQVSCRFKHITKKIDPRTGQVLEENPDFIKAGDAAEIVVEPLQPLCIEKQSDIPQLSKFAIRT